MGLAMQPFQLLVILLIVVLIFGTKKLKEVGGDLGGAIKSFKKAMNAEDEQPPQDQKQISSDASQPADKTAQRERQQS